MNIEQAKRIPIREIFAKLGFKPDRELENDLWYRFRDEKTASLHVNIDKNAWFDHGTGNGGDTIELVRHHLKSTREDSTVSDALRWLRNMVNIQPIKRPAAVITHVPEIPAWQLTSEAPLKNIALIRYLESRGIPFEVARQHLKEIQAVHKTKLNKIFALGLSNEEDGFEIRNPFIQSSIGPKAISFVRGEIVKPVNLHVFEGMMDYLSALSRFPDMVKRDDAIVLNTVSLIETALGYVRGYGYEVLYSWLDNDNGGEATKERMTEFARSQLNDLQHKPMNVIYQGYKDVNKWHTETLPPTFKRSFRPAKGYAF